MYYLNYILKNLLFVQNKVLLCYVKLKFNVL